MVTNSTRYVGFDQILLFHLDKYVLQQSVAPHSCLYDQYVYDNNIVNQFGVIMTQCNFLLVYIIIIILCVCTEFI